MVRAPCCSKAGLNKGPWTTEEDRILIDYINQNGHGNWRALPVRAGLLRCGKSCRLRWMNYLRPNIKRGNFTFQEEEAIIKLHAELGNKWSVIAAKLPGRTDNEIKNVWNTHLKKRLIGEPLPKSKSKSKTKIQNYESYSNFDQKLEKFLDLDSPMQAFSETTSATTAATADSGDFTVNMLTELESLTEMGESFWSEVFSGEDWTGSSDFPAGNSDNNSQLNLDEEMGNHFWQNVFFRAGESTDLFNF